MKKIGCFKLKPSNEIVDSVVSIGFECMDRQVIKPERCYDLLGDSGIKYARVQTGWALCEKEKGVIDFTWLDSIVNNLTDRGVIVWFSVGFGNPVYMPDLPNPTGVGCVPLYYSDECLEAWKNYARALAEHYRKRVSHYEIWNEPDGSQFWHPSTPSARDYARLIKLTADEIRSVNPDAKIGSVLASSQFDYVKELASSLEQGTIDFHCFHCYPKIPELYFPQHFKAVMQLFRLYGHELSYWMGEGGYPSWVYEGHWMNFRKGNFSSERQQAEAQLRMYFTDLALGLEKISFFQIADMWERPYEKATEVLQKPAAQGILNGRIYTPKCSYYTLSRLANLLCDDVHAIDGYFEFSLKGASATECALIRAHCFRRKDEIFVAYWLLTDVEDEIENRDGFGLTFICFADCELINEPVLIDMYTGDLYELEPLRRGEYRVSFDKLPIGGCPYVICSRGLLDGNIEDETEG